MKRIDVMNCRLTTVKKKKVGGAHCLEVEVARGGKIPLHCHNCAAVMVVTHGSARKLISKGKGSRVKPGSIVVKIAREPHGFDHIGKEGFKFLSFSDGKGILQGNGTMDLTVL